jgi:transposase
MRYDLSDFEWSVIEPVLPKGRRGPKRKDDRWVMNGIFWVRERERHGGICRSDMGRMRPPTTASIAGERLVSGIG